MDIEIASKITLIFVYSLFSIIRIEYYRRTRKAGYKTVIEEHKRYSVWLSIFICYTIFTFCIFLLFPQKLAWATVPLTIWLRVLGAFFALIALFWFIWIHRSLGNNLSTNLKIKDAQVLITDGPYRWIRHPMYTAFYLLHIAVFFLTANWFIGVTWLVGLSIIILLRVKREESMLITRFGSEYSDYMNNTGRFIPNFKRKAH